MTTFCGERDYNLMSPFDAFVILDRAFLHLIHVDAEGTTASRSLLNELCNKLAQEMKRGGKQ